MQKIEHYLKKNIDILKAKKISDPDQHNLRIDRVTGLPTLLSLYASLEQIIIRKPLGLIYVDIVDFKSVETLCGREICDQVLRNFGNFLRESIILFYGPRQTHGICSLGGDDILLFIDAPEKQDNFRDNYYELKNYLEEALNNANKNLNIENQLQIHLGYSNLHKVPGDRLETVIYKSIKDASNLAKTHMNDKQHMEWKLFKQIIYNERITTVFQPIISLKSGSIFAFEALSRGPRNTVFESPISLFEHAEKNNCLMDLEKLCLRNAVSNAQLDLKERKLFVNVNPLLLNSTNYIQHQLLELLQSSKIPLKNIVLELTERNGIEDYVSFREKLRAYRNLGFQIAIDDAGAGYSSLQAIAELVPEFVKIDISLIRGIDKNPIKRALLETLVNFTYKIGARIICEGIESQQELNTIAAMGCDYGQGFLLGRPGRIIEDLDQDIKHLITRHDRMGQYYHDIPLKIGDIVMNQAPINADISVEELIDRFNENKGTSGLVVVEKEYPVGLIMRDRLFSLLGSRYGYDLFVKKKVTQVMDKSPLIMPWLTSIDDAARQVAERLSQGKSDYLIITREERYAGVVSVSQLLDTLAAIQLEQAKDSNPLTGLPGNRLLTRRIIEDVRNSSDFMVLYFDLDNFKAFNDKFGFEHGDRAIVMLANILVEVAQKCGNADDLISHIGGDDFVIVTSIDKGEELAMKTIEIFDERIIDYYDYESIEKGFFIAHDRKGQQMQFPIMSLSVAGVVNKPGNKFENHLQVGEAAAEVKKTAKYQMGSCWVLDRRLSA